MEVFVVQTVLDYEPGADHGIFSTLEKAVVEWTAVLKDVEFLHPYVRIYKVVVDSPEVWEDVTPGIDQRQESLP